MANKKLPLGISDFRTMIEEDYTYVDKSLFIQELIEANAKVILIPRMRRFGKTLNLSMLQYFFEKSTPSNEHLFEGLKVWNHEAMRVLQGQFPVIFLTLKDVKFPTWVEMLESLARIIAKEFKRHLYLLDKEVLIAREKEIFTTILQEEASTSLLSDSLNYLTEWLHRYHGKRVILLIDEYDTPAHSAFVGGFYDTLIPFLRNWLSSALKDNKYLEKGVLTGILRIAKETIFSGLNNVITFTILSDEFQDKFGFIEAEVKELLEEYGLQHKLDEMRRWYNGYRIGSLEGIYNPWSILNCLSKKGEIAPYWVNTSENALMKQLVTKGPSDLKSDLEHLLNGASIEKKVEEGVVFSELSNQPDAIWSLLLFSGYLTTGNRPSYGKPILLRIPNLEVEQLYRSLITEWFKNILNETNYRLLLRSLVTGDLETFSQIFQNFFSSAVSVFDVAGEEPEKIYHAFVLGMLVGLKDTYEIKSNRESGYGRYDVMLIPKNPRDLGLIIEFKKADTISLEEALQQALKQIEEKNYAQELRDRQIANILCLAIAFKGKKVQFLTR